MIFLLLTSCTTPTKQGDTKSGQHHYSLEKEIRKTINADYLLYIPEEYTETHEEWPLILFLHGYVEGIDLSMLETWGIPKLIAENSLEIPFVVLSPKCPENGWWSTKMEIESLDVLLNEIVSKYRIDINRIYVTGYSMGGMGTWALAAMYPDRFAAIAPICGYGDPKNAEKIAHLPIWVFHGAKDPALPVKVSEAMVDALKEAGSQVKFTVYPDADHDAWTLTYENPELYEWFLKHKLSGDDS